MNLFASIYKLETRAVWLYTQEFGASSERLTLYNIYFMNQVELHWITAINTLLFDHSEIW